MNSFKDWWPYGSERPDRVTPANAPEISLKFREQSRLVDLQPYILRWGVVWCAVTIVYSVSRWIPPGDGRTAFIVVCVLLWFCLGGMTIALLVQQARRRQAVANAATPPSPSAD